MSPSKKQPKGLVEFEAAHGGPKIARLAKELEVERSKVAAMAGKRERVFVAEPSPDNTIRFAVVSDTHYGSLYSVPDCIAAVYERAVKAGCRTVLHAGDVIDGWRMYKGHEFELADVGFDAQICRMVQAVPRFAGVQTKFITGNHDESFHKLIGVDVGAAIQAARPDMICVGEGEAVVEFRTRDGRPYKVGLYHLGGGTAYALSYRVQRHVSSLEGGKKPDMSVYGHFHKAETIPSIRNVYAMQAGSGQRQTPYMRDKASDAHVGGWIVEVQPGDGWHSVKAEFIAFYK